MAWTTPRTWTPGETVTASMMNVHVRDNLSDLNTRMNSAPQLSQETLTTVDGNGSLVLAATTTVAVLNMGGAQDINGATVPPRSPWSLALVNVNGNIQTIKNEDATEPTQAKRIITPNNADFLMGLADGLLMYYITVPAGARWVSVVAA